MQRLIYQKKYEYLSFLPYIINKHEKTSHFWENYGFTNNKPSGHFSVIFLRESFIYFISIFCSIFSSKCLWGWYWLQYLITIAGRTAKIYGLVVVLVLHIDGVMLWKAWPGQEKLILCLFTCKKLCISLLKIEWSQFSLVWQEKLCPIQATSSGQVLVKSRSCQQLLPSFPPSFWPPYKP